MNQYHIYEAIGRGKYSTVYKGRKKKTIEYYAIKSVDKSQRSKVLHEVKILHSLDHQNVLKFYECHYRYETSAHLWLILEYCVGGDLLSILRQVTSTCTASIVPSLFN
ncbi:serine/threonine-protein kinase RUNKEL-like isoform X1 [Arachis hypogaea]|uniref:serine/threonine-protein kinase RUNKEL-like isoform X1 n=1 Tax=Arachis hypogaea TaxID=3818 RepID=UPI000DECF30B|nr:serine/threonine-protein kinase RUNKEL-like isoform X1 [Arachis hypogaea]